MSFKERSIELLMSIPHLALLWEVRKHQRFEPCEGLDIEIKHNNEKIYALLLDISSGGMRIASTDNRIADSETISLSVNDFRVELPCENIKKIEYQYGIKFGPMDKQENSNLEYFIEHYTKTPPISGLSVILK